MTDKITYTDGMDRRISIAPMMDWTDRHDRAFLRLISRHAVLFSEMVTTGAVIHGDRDKLLGYSEQEHPLVLQLGGSDPAAMAESARIGADWGYKEININVGCPSDRVQSGSFGACLMAEPDLVARCVEAMQAAVDVPVSVKCRIGIDDQDPQDSLFTLVERTKNAGCQIFYVHARKAWLQGLSPKENRDIPPLDYDLVYALKAAHPDLFIAINGGIKTMTEAQGHLAHVDGVMIGREAYQNPYILADVDQMFYGSDTPALSRQAIIEAYLPYVEEMLANGWRLNSMTRHILGLFQGQRGARMWRRHLSSEAHKPTSGVHTIVEALQATLPAPQDHSHADPVLAAE